MGLPVTLEKFFNSQSNKASLTVAPSPDAERTRAPVTILSPISFQWKKRGVRGRVGPGHPLIQNRKQGKGRRNKSFVEPKRAALCYDGRRRNARI